MSYREFPTEVGKGWQGAFDNEYLGDFSETFNIDADIIKGRLVPSLRPTEKFGTNNPLEDTYPRNFVKTSADGTSRWWAVTYNYMLKDDGGWAQDGLASSPSQGEDMVVHGENSAGERLFVTLHNDIAVLNDGGGNAWDSSWWVGTKGKSGLTTDYHPIARLENLVAVGDGPELHTIDKDDIISTGRIIVPAGYIIDMIYVTTNRFWIGCNREDGRGSTVLEWDGFSEVFNKKYGIEGKLISGFAYQEVPYFVNWFGQIFGKGANAFKEVARFPIYNSGKHFEEPQPFNSPFVIDRRGCDVAGKIVKMLAAPKKAIPKMRAGIWSFRPETGELYHSNSLGKSNNDYGQTLIGSGASVGAITSDLENDIYYTGGIFYPDSTVGGTERHSIFEVPIYLRDDDSTNNSVAFFVTPKIRGEDLDNLFEKIKILATKPRTLSSSGSIIVKIRDGKMSYTGYTPGPGTTGNASAGELNWAEGTWVNKHTIKEGAYKVPNWLDKGHEVEITDGDNAGDFLTVDHFEDSGGNKVTDWNGGDTYDLYIVFTEDSLVSNGNTSLVYFHNWYEVARLSANSDSLEQFVIPGMTESVREEERTLNHRSEVDFKILIKDYQGLEIERLYTILQGVNPIE